MIRCKFPLILGGCLICISSQVIADEKDVATEYFDGSTISFDFKGNFSNATLSVTGPNGFNSSIFRTNGAPTLNLSQSSDNSSGQKSLSGKSSTSALPSEETLVDGKYNYQITVATDEIIKVVDKGNNGREENSKTTKNVGKTQSGFFRVKDGAIVSYLDIQEGE